MTLPSSLLDAGESGLGQETPVLADRRATDRPARCEIDDPHGSRSQRTQQIPAYGVGQCGEGVHIQLVTHWLPMVKSRSTRVVSGTPDAASAIMAR